MAKSKLEQMHEEHKLKIAEIEMKMQEANRMGDLDRARSYSFGSAFGGSTEISMRTNDGRNIWAILTPVEVVEIIHQLAANVGCHIHLAPREDFASWRDWHNTKEELDHFRDGGAALGGRASIALTQHPPQAKALKYDGNNQVADILSHLNEESALLLRDELDTKIAQLTHEENEDEVAIKKDIDKRSTKRSRKTSE